MMATLEVWPHPAQLEFLTSEAETRLFIGGLGSGKTFGGWVDALQRTAEDGVGLFLAPTYPMIRDVMLATLEAHFLPFVRSVNRSAWSVELVNGVRILMRSATRPDSLRGINAGWGWADEACFCSDEALAIWNSRIRVGRRLKVMTTTPIKGSYVYRTYIEGGAPAHVIRCVSSDNPYLSAEYVAAQRQLMSAKEAARELDAEWVDADGVLFDAGSIAAGRVDAAPLMTRYVIGVDPAVTSTRRSDRTGIVLIGVGRNGHAYVLDDLSGQYAPHEWAAVVHDVYARYRAAGCVVVAEVNQGGDLVERNLRAHNPSIAFRGVRAVRSKRDRAQPVATHYAQGRVHHVGLHRELERQMTTWEPTDADSPDRLDALVWAITEAAPMDCAVAPSRVSVSRRSTNRVIA
jgi:phage terminase large subunit-like protein